MHGNLNFNSLWISWKGEIIVWDYTSIVPSAQINWIEFKLLKIENIACERKTINFVCSQFTKWTVFHNSTKFKLIGLNKWVLNINQEWLVIQYNADSTITLIIRVSIEINERSTSLLFCKTRLILHIIPLKWNLFEPWKPRKPPNPSKSNPWKSFRPSRRTWDTKVLSGINVHSMKLKSGCFLNALCFLFYILHTFFMWPPL